MQQMRVTKPKKWTDYPPVRLTLLTIGWILLLGAPLLGPLPGPGPLFIMPFGLALILRNSLWAKRQYARHSKRHPEYGAWANWALRRSRAKDMPPLPDFKRDLIHFFRRDDIDHPMV
jgi:hypothetical protein